MKKLQGDEGWRVYTLAIQIEIYEGRDAFVTFIMGNRLCLNCGISILQDNGDCYNCSYKDDPKRNLAGLV